MAGKMTPMALMLMRSGDNNRRDGDGDGRRDYQTRREPWPADYPGRMTYIPPYGEPDMRRRNYPMGDYDGEMESRRRNYPRSAYDRDMIEDRRMGFGEQPMDNYDHEMRRRRNDGARMRHGGSYEHEPIRFGGMVSMEGGGMRGGHHKLTREMAEEWVDSMEGSDPAKQHGGKWTMDQVKPVATKYGIPTEGERFWEFWAVMNAMYSDYYPVAKKYNVLTPDFFADLAMAFISDKDAVENKSTVYYECIVK